MGEVVESQTGQQKTRPFLLQYFKEAFDNLDMKIWKEKWMWCSKANDWTGKRLWQPLDLQFWHVVTYEVMSTCPAGIDGLEDTSEAEAAGAGANNAVGRDEWKWRDASEWDCCQGYKADCDIRAASGDAPARLRSWIRMILSDVDADDPKITIPRLQSWLHMIHVRRYSRLHYQVKKWMTWAGPGHDPSLHLNCTFQALQSLSTIHLL